jgi:hypothetical protein
MTTGVLRSVGKRVASMAARLDDALSPIAVKELRQAVNAKYISGLLMFLLFGQMVAMAAFVLSSRRQEYDFEAGRQSFMIFFSILAVVGVWLLPSYVLSRGIYDRMTNNEELSRITALRARSFVWGRLSSGLVLTALIYSACAPFLVFSYLLRGIDLGSILLVMLVGFAASALAIQVAVFLSSIPLPKLFMPLLGLIGVGAGFFIAMGTASFTVGYMEDPFGLATGRLAMIVGTGLTLMVLIVGFLFALSVAVTSPRSANRALPVRLLTTAMWAPSLALALLVSAPIAPSVPFELWFIVCVCLYAMALAFVVSERDVQGVRVLRRVPRRRWLRPAAFALYSGSAGGVVWWTIMVTLTLIAGGAVWPAVKQTSYRGFYYPYGYWWAPDVVTTLIWGIVYVYAYALTAALIRRWFLPKLRPFFTWIMAIGVGAVAFVLPSLTYLLAVSFGFPPHDWLEWQVTTPLVLICWDPGFRALGHWVASAWALSVALLNAGWIVERYRAFRRFDPGVPTRVIAVDDE